MRKTTLKNRLAMYDNLQQQVNYLPSLKSGQLGLPFKEDLRVQNQIDSDCCIGFDIELDAVSGLTAEEPGDGTQKPLGVAEPEAAVPPDKRGRQAKRSKARRTSEKAAKAASGATAEPIPGCSAVLPVTDDDDESFDFRNYGTGSQY